MKVNYHWILRILTIIITVLTWVFHVQTCVLLWLSERTKSLAYTFFPGVSSMLLVVKKPKTSLVFSLLKIKKNIFWTMRQKTIKSLKNSSTFTWMFHSVTTLTNFLWYLTPFQFWVISLFHIFKNIFVTFNLLKIMFVIFVLSHCGFILQRLELNIWVSYWYSTFLVFL